VHEEGFDDRGYRDKPMMKNCEWSLCANWAQWMATYPDKRLRFLCCVHETELAKENLERDLKNQIKFTFVGSVPLGFDRT
jgi:hypothetical protein